MQIEDYTAATRREQGLVKVRIDSSLWSDRVQQKSLISFSLAHNQI